MAMVFAAAAVLALLAAGSETGKISLSASQRVSRTRLPSDGRVSPSSVSLRRAISAAVLTAVTVIFGGLAIRRLARKGVSPLEAR